MSRELDWVAKATGATSARRVERTQSLWSGYGEIVRLELTGADVETVVVKSVQPPVRVRGAKKDVSHARKCRSYDVETTWYRTFSSRCDDTCRVPRFIDARGANEEWLIALEDIDAAGFPERRRDPGASGMDACLRWLAAFHARFLGVAPEGLWKNGTYWHLATRQDELAAMEDAELRAAAPLLDQKLRACAFQTLVHGDAKPANFCFARGGAAVAAVDFQYVGGGCGMKDVAYLLSDDPAEPRWLDVYFGHLRSALDLRPQRVDVGVVEREWRALYPIARADYHRFLAGWAREHWRRDVHAQKLTREVLRTL
jgi:hypothetical protein